MCGPLFSRPPHIKPCWPPENIVPRPNPALLCPTINGKMHGQFYYANIIKNILPFREKIRFVNSVNSTESCLKLNRKKKQTNKTYKYCRPGSIDEERLSHYPRRTSMLGHPGDRLCFEKICVNSDVIGRGFELVTLVGMTPR